VAAGAAPQANSLLPVMRRSPPAPRRSGETLRGARRAVALSTILVMSINKWRHFFDTLTLDMRRILFAF
jgi:hypothetical protein